MLVETIKKQVKQVADAKSKVLINTTK